MAAGVGAGRVVVDMDAGPSSVGDAGSSCVAIASIPPAGRIASMSSCEKVRVAGTRLDNAQHQEDMRYQKDKRDQCAQRNAEDRKDDPANLDYYVRCDPSPYTLESSRIATLQEMADNDKWIRGKALECLDKVNKVIASREDVDIQLFIYHADTTRGRLQDLPAEARSLFLILFKGHLLRVQLHSKFRLEGRAGPVRYGPTTSKRRAAARS